MKWEAKQPAHLGQARIVERFALLPTKCVGNYSSSGVWTEYWVWLEHYTETQEYKRVMVEEFGHGFWKEQWVPVGTTIIQKEKK